MRSKDWQIPVNSDIRQIIGLTVGIWLLSGLLYLAPLLLFQSPREPGYVLATLSVISVSGMGLSGGVFWAARTMRNRSAALRFVAMGAAVLLASALLALVDALTSQLISPILAPGAPMPPFALRAISNFVALVWQFALLGAVYAVLEANNLTREKERELAAAREATSRAQAVANTAQLAALRWQLNPHVLFNTLNAVSSLIVTRRLEQADEMVGKLSEFLRATLTLDPAKLVRLEDELATLQDYLEIESVRFEDRLAVAFDCEPDLHDAEVPSFILQPLVENCIKYAVAPAERMVTIEVSALRDQDDLVMIVADDGAALAANEISGGTGVGLANIRARLGVLYGERASLDAQRTDEGYRATVRIPLVRAGAGAVPA